MLDQLSAQLDSASSNLCILSNSFDFDYEAHTAGYGDGLTEADFKKVKPLGPIPGPSLELQSPIPPEELSSQFSRIVSRMGRKFKLADSGSPRSSISAESENQSVILQQAPKDEEVSSSAEQQSPREQVGNHAPAVNRSASADTLHCELQHCENCECAGECIEPDWCRRLDALNSQVVAMIEEGEVALAGWVGSDDVWV